MRFSNLADRLAAKRNRLYTEYERAASSGRTILDLISANLAEQGWVFPQERLQAILAEAADGGYTFSSLVLGIARSVPFQMREAAAETE